MRKILSALIIFLACINLSAQKPLAIALRARPSGAEAGAARLLQAYLQQITAQSVPVPASGAVPEGYAPVFIGAHPDLPKYGLQNPPDLQPDAFFLQGKNGAFLIAGGGEMGAEYGVYSLLELLGCRKYSPRDSFIPEIKNLLLPDYQAKTEIPAFPYRELHYEPAFDEGWARWHKLKTNPKKNEEWGMFVHTFHRLCPEEKYFAEHPEYFAWNGKQRSTGQLCLSNDTVKQIVIAALREAMREKPAAKYWSVSQNDNFDYCKCARCAASDVRYGSPAGTLLAFVNEIAAVFPDKTISTLAYQYTRRAPQGIRPAPNVSVCLCSIECNRGKDIEEGCTDFARDVEEWSQLTDNLMIWDYVVQFRSYVSPFPNWHTLQPNLRFFQKHGVKMMFEQGSGRDRSEFSDMRAYLLAKLMWNPQANMDSILTDFGDGYYGAARPAIWEYVDSLTTKLLRSGARLDIYATPQMEAHTFLCEECVAHYTEVLKKAIDAAPDDSAQKGRALAASLPVLYADLELEKILDNGTFIPDQKGGARYLPFHKAEDVAFFVKACRAFGFNNLHERGYSPEQYSIDYQKYIEEGHVWHQFLQRKIHGTGAPVFLLESAAPPSPQYEHGSLETLLDGRRGTDDYHYNWLGYQGNDLNVTVRVISDWPDNELPNTSSVSIQFLQDQQSWIFFPEKVKIEISSDGEHFQTVGEENIDIKPDGEKSVRRVEKSFTPQRLRAIRVTAVNRKTCPPWHSCNGNPCWIFADEIVVR